MEMRDGAQRAWSSGWYIASTLGPGSTYSPDDTTLTGYLNVTEDTPPIFMFHTTEDSAVPQENSLLMAQALAEKKIPYELHMFMDGDHGLGLALGRPGLEKWGELASIWLKKLGF